MHRTTRRRGAAILALAVAALTAAVLLVPSSAPAATRRHPLKVHAFHDQMRTLWEDHITWTRLFIVSFVADLPDLDATTARLLQNQTDIAQAIEPFYGRAAADQLESLLRDHILGAADVLTAAKNGDDAAFATASDAWYANAREIADFLHAANPHEWPRRDMRQMMTTHLDLTLAEAADQLNGNYEASVADYDAVRDEILEMADMLSDGIVAQFPARFGR